MKSDRVIRTLTALASFGYYFMWAGAAVVLIGLPLIRLFGEPLGGFYFGLEVPLTSAPFSTRADMLWGWAPLTVDAIRTKLELPISEMPWPLLALLWSYTAAFGALVLLVLQNLRRLFQRVRDGAAFDAQNVVRLRRLGALLLAIAGLNAAAGLATSIVVRRGLAAVGSSLTVPSGIHIDMALVPVALVLMVLAEVFRRGTDLEHEQSLVV